MTRNKRRFKVDPKGTMSWKKRSPTIILLVVCFTLLVGLVRENEGRTAAEEKLRQVQYKVDRLSSQKDSAISQLETENTDLKARLDEAFEHARLLEQEKNDNAQRFESDLRERDQKHADELAEKAAELSELDERMNDLTARQEAAIKDKNEEISDLGTRLAASSSKIAELLKKLQAAESRQIAGEKQIASLEIENKRLKRQNDNMTAAIQKAQSAAVQD